MSARLIKLTAAAGTEPFAPFAIPANDHAQFLAMTAKPVMVLADPPETHAERIIADAQTRAIEIEQRARADAQAMIQAEITEEISRTVDPWREQLTRSIAELANARSSIADQAERELVSLAVEIARKVVRTQITVEPDIVITLARNALSRLQHRTAAAIHLHPDDFAYVNTHAQALAGNHAVELIEDHSIERGGCLITTEMGDVDARIDQQFAEIERGLREN
jgi:flagellar assembly protein FliH